VSLDPFSLSWTLIDRSGNLVFERVAKMGSLDRTLGALTEKLNNLIPVVEKMEKKLDDEKEKTNDKNVKLDNAVTRLETLETEWKEFKNRRSNRMWEILMIVSSNVIAAILAAIVAIKTVAH
jgi:chromosome segregation ATPase